jgi:hypothetical protein
LSLRSSPTTWASSLLPPEFDRHLPTQERLANRRSGRGIHPDGMQRLLGTARWDAGEVRDDLRSYVVEHLGEPEGVLIVDETGFLKRGNKSVGVKRQYSGTACGTENCQVAVFLCCASASGAAFIDRALYFSREWAKDQQRRAEAGIPEEVGFTTKPALAQAPAQRVEDHSPRGTPGGCPPPTPPRSHPSIHMCRSSSHSPLLALLPPVALPDATRRTDDTVRGHAVLASSY